MKLTQEELKELLKVCISLGLVTQSKNGSAFNDKIVLMIKHIDQLKALYEEWERLTSNKTIKLNYPAIHKTHGPILVVSSSVGIKDDILQNTTIKCVTVKGETLEVPYDEVVPYNTSTEVLFGTK